MISFQAFVLSSTPEGWIWALFTIGAGGYLFFRGFRVLQRKRLIQNTPASKIRSASIGLVEVNGLAVGPRVIQSPIAGIPCYYYRTIAWRQNSSSRNRNWEKVADETLHVPFYLDDNTGMVLVNPQGAELDLHCDFRQEFSPSLLSGTLNLPSGVASFVARNGVTTDKKLKIEEYCIKPKNALFILGTLAPNPDADLTTPLRSAVSTASASPQRKIAASDSPPGAATTPATSVQSTTEPSARQIIRLQDSGRATCFAAMSQQQKVAAALNRAGIANPAAWATAESQYPGVTAHAAAAPVPAAAGAAAAVPALDINFDLRPKTMLMKGRNDPGFMISWRSQRQLVRSLGWRSTLMIWGGPALALLSLYVVLGHFGWM